jgi:hypothetical protein
MWTKMKKNKLKKELEWFCGFSEGDGSWNVCLHNGQIGNCSFIINQKESSVLYKIRKLVGYGSVNGPYFQKDGSSYHRYYVGCLGGTAALISIFNGELVLDKCRKSFSSYVTGYNIIADRTTNGAIPIKLINKGKVPSLKTGWLSGFIDAEGCFNVYYRYKDSEVSRIGVRFSIGQSYGEWTMSYLTGLFDGSSSNYKKNTYTKLIIEKENEKRRLINYLEIHRLRSDKHLAYTKWKKIFIRLTDGSYKDRMMSTRSRKRLFRLADSLKSFNSR